MIQQQKDQFTADLTAKVWNIFDKGSVFYGKIARTISEHVNKYLPQGEGWISVEDEKPPIDEWVLFYNGHWRGVGKYKPDEDDDYPHPPYQDENSQWIEPYPTHWQPLPAPPSDKNNER